VTEIRPIEGPLDHGAGALIAALMARMGVDRVTVDASELGDVEVWGHWNYAAGEITLEVRR
jgi:hypothetical protein